MAPRKISIAKGNRNGLGSRALNEAVEHIHTSSGGRPDLVGEKKTRAIYRSAKTDIQLYRAVRGPLPLPWICFW